jgi:hypothetical protein
MCHVRTASPAFIRQMYLLKTASLVFTRPMLRVRRLSLHQRKTLGGISKVEMQTSRV